MHIGRRRILKHFLSARLAGLAPAAEHSPPRLTILLLAGQFRADYFEQREWSFSTGGFRRIFRDAALYPDCRLNSSSFDSTALATLTTGAMPSLHGVVAERWFDRQSHAPADGRAPLLSGSLMRQFRAADPRNRVYTVAFQPALADLLSDGSADFAFSLDPDGRFRTAAEPPSWLEEFRKNYNPETWRNTTWMASGAPKDAPPMRALSYDAAKPAEYQALFRGSPLAMAMQFALLRELVTQSKLGHAPGRDLLLVHLDSLSILGQQLGANSPPVAELVTDLDRQLSSFFELLDQRVGAANYHLVFAGVHGLADRPPTYIARRAQEVVDAVNTALAQKAVEAYLYPFLYLKPLERDMRPVRLAAGRALLASGLASSFLTLDGNCSHTGEWRTRLQNSFHSVRSGDLILSYPPQVFERFGDGEGISYGSLYNYDGNVPVAFLGSAFRPGVYAQTVESIDIAPTLARALGIGLPSSSTGRVLYNALVPARLI